jgi:prevent-host-death family protein
VADVSIRELRNHGGDVIERVLKGELVTVTRSGKPVAQLRALARTPVPLEELIRKRAHLPRVDVVAMRSDIDDVLDASI